MKGCDFVVTGMPGPQGSKKHVGHGVMVEMSKLVRPWRHDVIYAFRETRAPMTAGPVHVEIVFVLPRPQKPKYPWPIVKDIDKLLRSTFDALTMAGAITDDRFVICSSAAKVFTGDPAGLPHPGARIKIRSAL